MWIRQPTSNAPLARCAHAADRIGSKLYMFGGWSESKIFNDLHVYDPDNQMWTKLHDDKIDPNVLTTRSGHSATAVGTKLLIFGGGSTNETSNLFLNDIFFFETQKMEWEIAYACGPAPAGRTKHTATLIGSKLFVFGGGDGLRLYNDIFFLDLETMMWNIPSCKGTPPCPRWGHSTVQVGNLLVIFGGHDGINRLGDVHIFDTENMIWRQEMCSRRSPPEVPSPCAGHTASMVGPHMLVWGGGDGHVLTDMYALDTRNWQWWWAGNAPGTCAHTTTLVGNKLIAFGGGDGVFCFNDLYTFDVSDELRILYQLIPQNLKVMSPSKHAPVHPPPLSVSPPKVVRPMHTTAKRPPLPPPIPSTIPSTSTNQTPNSIPLARLTTTPTSTPQTITPNHPSTSPTASTSISNITIYPTTSQGPIPTSPPSLHDGSAHPPISETIIPENGNPRLPPLNMPLQSPPPTNNNNKSRRNSSGKSRSASTTPTSTPTTTPPASPRDPHLPNGNPIPKNNPNNTSNSNIQNGNEGRSRRNSRARKEDRPQNISKWLSGLGMSKYLDRFVAEEIDVDILDMVNESHFKMLGIPLGDRLRLCAAVSKFAEK